MAFDQGIRFFTNKYNIVQLKCLRLFLILLAVFALPVDLQPVGDPTAH